MANRYKVTLTKTEREQLTELTRSGNSTAAKFIHARALLCKHPVRDPLVSGGGIR
ncbi:MAG TPA: hypothetical protein VGM73_07250 [Candidatus Didemnitutus sp.]